MNDEHCATCTGRGYVGTYDAYEYANGRVLTFTVTCETCAGTGRARRKP